MQNGNGNGVTLMLKIAGTVVGVVTVLITIYVVFHQPLAYAIDKEKDERLKDLIEVRKDIQLVCIKQYEQSIRNTKQYSELDKKLERVLVKLEVAN